MTPALEIFNEQNKQRMKNVVDLVTDVFTHKKVKAEKYKEGDMDLYLGDKIIYLFKVIDDLLVGERKKLRIYSESLTKVV
jgi:hypothetical protein